ncbi:MAG TPA: PepSY domain-containing protein [Chloroflexia bacterium]
MNNKTILGSTAAVALLGLGMLAGSVVGTSQAFAQTGPATASPTAVVTTPAAPATTPSSGPSTVPVAPGTGQAPSAAPAPAITQQQAEQAALAARPGNTVDHTHLMNDNGQAFWDVDFSNGGGVKIDAQTGAVIAVEAAGTDQGGPHGDHGADQAALAAQATVSQADAEKAALAASPGNTIDHSRLGDDNGTVYWDVDFTNGGGVEVNAQTGAIIAVEAAGTDQGGPHGGHGPRGGAPNGAPNTAPSTTPDSSSGVQ